jgi:MFS family permease
LLDGIVPLYPLYALLFADTGLSDPSISLLFVIWTAVGLVAEVPTGALADRFSRRHAVVASGIARAACYGLWTAFPGFAAFACGFALWGLGGALSSGALEALVYENLPDRYARVLGWIRAAEMVAQVPTAAAATALFAVGGFRLVGWASVVTCLCAAVLAVLLPEASPREHAPYRATLRTAIDEVRTSDALRAAVISVALLGGIDAVEEYFTLIADRWGVPIAVIPFAVLAVPLAGAAGAAMGGRRNRLRPALLGAALATGAIILGATAMIHQPVGLLGVALFYGLYRLVYLVADARLQDQITSDARATVTSVAELGNGLTCFAVYGAWALHQVIGVAAVCLAVGLVLPLLLSRSKRVP